MERVEHLKNWKKSGLSKREYARENGINRNTFYGWFRKIEEPKPLVKSDMVEIKLPGTTRNFPGEKARGITVTTKNGYILSVPPGFDHREVGSLLDLLEVR